MRREERDAFIERICWAAFSIGLLVGALVFTVLCNIGHG